MLREEPPTELEFGAQVRNAREPLWVVGTGLNREQVRRAADLEALEALTTVVEEALLRVSLSDEMSRMAHHDALTGLPNRTLFLDRAELAVVDARGSGHDVAVLFIDLDGFKAINDRFGHGAGDELLIEVANRLTSSVRSIDLAGRLGGDEFAVLVEKVTSLHHLIELAGRIIGALGSGFSVRGNDVADRSQHRHRDRRAGRRRRRPHPPRRPGDVRREEPGQEPILDSTGRAAKPRCTTIWPCCSPRK